MRLSNYRSLLCAPQLLCWVNAAFFANVLPLHVCYEQLFLQIALCGTGYLCVLHAASTYLYQSNYGRARQHMRIVLIIMLFISSLCLCLAVVFFQQFTKYDKLRQSTAVNKMFTSYQSASITTAITLTALIIIIMVVVIVLVLVTVIQRVKKRDKKHLEKQAS
ncbi:hypothetical protein KR009_007205, partial [Drosophila setifemur]